jgi:deoxyribonuclease-4
MTKFRIGRHIRVMTTHDLLTGPAYAKEIGCQIMQIFLGNPQVAVSKPRSEADLKAFGIELQLHKMKVIIHGHYSINFCQPSDSSRFRTSLRSMISDLKSSALIGKRSLGVIIHMGKNKTNLTEKQALQNYVYGLKMSLAMTPNIDVPIILETGAGVGQEVGYKLDQLAWIYHHLTPLEQNRIRFCIDTCHIWSAGYDISTKKGVKDFFEEFNKKIGINKIICFHFNNSMNELGSHTDRHADLAYGMINLDGMEALAKFAYKHHIPLIMETPLIAVNPKTNDDITFEDEKAIVNKWIGQSAKK